jgi:TolA-binding protein
MPVLTATWNFVKAHWQVVVLCLAVGVGWGWFKHQQASSAQAIAQLNVSHQVEIDQINRARDDEAKQHQQELQDLQTSLAQIQSDYVAAQAALQQKQTQETQAIIVKYGNDVSGLAELLASRMNFTVVTPPVQP